MSTGKRRDLKFKTEFNALSLIAYKKAGIIYPAMQQGQPMRSGCSPAEPYPHGCNNIVAKIKSK
jgi:hypothetical protein